MAKGFFIVIKSQRIPFKQRVPGNQPVKLVASLLHPIEDWREIPVDDAGQVISLFQDLYQQRMKKNLSLLDLTTETEGPKADGRMVRFVRVS